MLGLLEREGEGVEHLARAKPHELIRADVDIHAECLRVRVAEARVGAVGCDDEVVVAPLWVSGFALGFEVEFHVEIARAVGQDSEQPFAADADEAVAAGRDRLSAEMHVDVVPVGELFGNGLGGDRVVAGDVLDGEVGENDAPAEGHALRIALENLNLVRRVAQLH